MLFQRGKSYCLYWVFILGCWINVFVTRISSCITEVKIKVLWEYRGPTPQTPTEARRAGLPLKSLIFPWVKWHADPQEWWQSILPMCGIQDMLWHCHAASTLGKVNNTAQGTGGCFDISLLPREQQRTPSRLQVNKLPVKSSICKPDLWSHSPVSSYPPKICVTSSGKRTRHLKIGWLRL